MAKSKAKPGKGDETVKKILTQARILDLCKSLDGVLSRLRQSVQAFRILDTLTTIPNIPLREFLANLKKRDLDLAAQISEIRKELEFAGQKRH